MSRRSPTRVDVAAQEWTGPWRHYDIVKEGVIALVVVSLLTVGLAVLFGSPDEPSLTFKGWATNAPDNFYATTVAELAGTSESAGYGPPYNSAAEGLAVGPLNPQQWFGVTHPVDPPNDFVITPLRAQPAPPAAGVASSFGTPPPRSSRQPGPRTTTPRSQPPEETRRKSRTASTGRCPRSRKRSQLWPQPDRSTGS